LEDLEEDIKERQKLAHYLLNICVCFREIHGRFLDREGYGILQRLIFSFRNGILQVLGPELVYGIYHGAIGRYCHLHMVSTTYFNAISIVYQILKGEGHDAPPFSPFDLVPDLSYSEIPFPFIPNCQISEN